MKSIARLIYLPLLLITSISFGQNPPETTATEAKGSFRDIPILKEAFIDASPTDRKDGIPLGELGIDGGNKAMILKLAKEIAENKDSIFDSFLIAHKGKLLFESYFTRGRINLPHPQASATKAYTSLLLGRAIQLGYLTMSDLDKPLISFLKDLDSSKFVEGVEKITLHKALTMRGGLQLSKEQREEIDKHPAAVKGQGAVQVRFERSAPITSASQHFSYGNFNPELVMQVIEAVVPGTAQDFIKNELLKKMGIVNYDWQTAASGLPESGWRMSITSRDMIKMGILAMNKGKWNGEQLIPEAFIAKATSRILLTGDDSVFGGGKDVSNQGYGYFWWNADLQYGNKSYFSSSAQGGGGQYIVLIEELDLIVVATGHNNRGNGFLQIIAAKIIPAFVKDEALILEGPYLGQEPPGLIPEVFAPGIVSTARYELFSAFTPDMKEFYFVRYDEEDNPSMIGYKYKNNSWCKSIIGPRVGEPAISPDGKTMHLGRRYMERTDTGWSAIKELEGPFKDIRIMRLTSSAKGTYYFDEATEDGPIRYSRIIDGKREEPKPLELDLGKFNAHPFIAPDESYLIWDDQRDSGLGKADIYISFRQPDGSWGPAINMGDKINSDQSDSYATVTPDGKYILFNRGIDKDNVDIYWVDAQIIETLRPQ